MSSEVGASVPLAVHAVDVGAGHRLHVVEYGARSGQPAVVLHGGPGSGCSSALTGLFDLDRTRVILVDQRGAGLSQPRGSLRANNTQALIADLEVVRSFLGVDAWLVVGGSWGASLGIAYASAYPRSVSGLVLRGTFLTGTRDLEWFFGGLKSFAPQAWEEFSAPSGGLSGLALLDWYGRRLRHAGADLQMKAAAGWSKYEACVMALCEGRNPLIAGHANYSAEELQQIRQKYRIQAHYLLHRCFLGEGQLLRLARALRVRRAIVLHGTSDFICRPENATKVVQAIPNAELRWVIGVGHAWTNPRMEEALKSAIGEISN